MLFLQEYFGSPFLSAQRWSAKDLLPDWLRWLNRRRLAAAPGVVVFDAPDKTVYPLPLAISGSDEVYVGRIREDECADRGLNMWVVSVNLRKGSALNAVQIAETLIAWA